MDERYISKEPVSFSTPEELKALIEEGENSGQPILMSAEEWHRLYEDAERESRLRRKAS